MGVQGQVDPEGNCSVEVREKRRKIENEMSCAMAANWVEISLAKTTTEQGRAGPPPALPSPLPTSLPHSNLSPSKCSLQKDTPTQAQV